MNIWEQMKSAVTPTTTVDWKVLEDLPAFDWVEFTKGVTIRKIPMKISGMVMLECKMDKGAFAERHDHNFFEAWTLIYGKMIDDASGVTVTPESPTYSCHIGTPHTPRALEDSLLYIFCKI